MTLRFTTKQAKYNKEAEGGFLGAMLSAASKLLPGIIAGLLAGSAESEVEGNGMFLGKRDYTYQLRHMGEGLLITPGKASSIKGFMSNMMGMFTKEKEFFMDFLVKYHH